MSELAVSPSLHWRAMRADDLAAVCAIAGRVHPDYPEDAAVFADRLRCHAPGCLVLQGAQGLLGYVLSHPWRHGDPPPLNHCLGALPSMPDTYYLHDLALLPEARGSGAAGVVVRHLRAHARTLGLPGMSLVAVNDSLAFWLRQGFDPVELPALATRLASYDADARFLASH